MLALGESFFLLNITVMKRYLLFVPPTYGYILCCMFLALTACHQAPKELSKASDVAIKKDNTVFQLNTLLPADPQGKPVVYQVFTRLFGNKNTTNKPWGSIEENGVGKFSDFTDKALQGIKQLGVTHIWYTGVLHHDVIRDYTSYGISIDDPDVVKGRAGSPYAVKDYYSVNPDLANDPSNRLKEFEDLIQRTHNNGMQVIIDIVPNHLARNYQSLAKPAGVADFGDDDDTGVEYARDNNFYYVVGQPFQVPEPLNGYQPLGGESHPLADNRFDELPAKWTGNGARKAQPHFHDWYETVKVNYGVKPDGSYDFPRLPEQYMQKDYRQHALFWRDKDVPDSWKKFKHITHYWLDKGVDGFRYDMAEMVPVEFWSYLNSSIKTKYPDAFLLAEVYNPSLYRQYLQLGKMDYLYDKVGFYDTLKGVMQGKIAAKKLHSVHNQVEDIAPHMLHFLENHDEQRIASEPFAGKVGGAQMGMPAIVTSSLISRSPTLIYFGQEVGEDASEDLGFGDPSRTSIFDYGGVPSHQRWMNYGKFDGGQLSESERQLREFYLKVLNISAYHPAMQGDYDSVTVLPSQILSVDSREAALHSNADKLFAFTRTFKGKSLLVVSHFNHQQSVQLELVLPAMTLIADAFEQYQQQTFRHSALDLLTGEQYFLNVSGNLAKITLTLRPMQSVVIQL